MIYLSVLAGISMCIMVILIPLQVYLDASTRKELRNRHPEMWEQKISAKGPIAERRKFLTFVSDVDSQTSLDARLRIRIGRLRVVNRTYLVLFIAVIASMLAVFSGYW